MTIAANQLPAKHCKFPRELEVLLLCATTQMGTLGAKKLKDLLSDNIDWKVLVSMSRRHGLMPLLHKQLLSQARDSVPQDIAAWLGAQARAKARQNFILASELLRLKAIFDSLEIDFIPLKGPCLAADAYGSLSLRVFVDLDIIVRDVDVPKAQEALREAGYQPGPRKDKLSTKFMQSELFRRLTPEQSFSRGERSGGDPPFIVDLHWQLEPPFLTSIEFSTLLQTTVEIDLCGQRIRKLQPELELIYLCLHATRNQWREIRFLVDIEQIIRKHPELDWRSLYDLAKSVGAERKVDIALALCRRALKMSLPNLPNWKKHEIEHSQSLKKLVDITEDEWSWRIPRPFTLRYFWWYSVSIADHPMQSLEFLSRELLFPSVLTYELCPLPVPLYRLYHVVHPIVLLFVCLMTGMGPVSGDSAKRGAVSKNASFASKRAFGS